MKSYEALNLAIGKNTIEIAKALHVSTSLVHKWQEPSSDFTDSGAYNPLDRIETMIETLIGLDVSPKDAFAPLRYMAERFDQIIIPIPKYNGDIGTLSGELLKSISEFGDLARESSAALQDGIIAKREALIIEKEAWELINQVCLFMKKVQEAAKLR